MYQVWNSRIGAWQKFGKNKNGKMVIKDVKQREPKKPFKGVPKKN